MNTLTFLRLDGTELEAWRSYLQSHASILRLLDAELIAEHGLTARDYEVLLYLAQADERKLPMSAIAESTMLTRSGITRLVDGLVECGLIERVSCRRDARVSYAQLTDAGYEKLREAGQDPHRRHPPSIPRALQRRGDRPARHAPQPPSWRAAVARARSSPARSPSARSSSPPAVVGARARAMRRTPSPLR